MAYLGTSFPGKVLKLQQLGVQQPHKVIVFCVMGYISSWGVEKNDAGLKYEKVQKKVEINRKKITWKLF